MKNSLEKDARNVEYSTFQINPNALYIPNAQLDIDSPPIQYCKCFHQFLCNLSY